MLNVITSELATYPRVDSEPPLKPYVYAHGADPAG